MLKVISIDEHEHWDEIVSTFENHDIYYYSHHAKLYEIHGDGTPTLIYYADETCRGIHVGMLRDIAQNDTFKNVIEEDTYFDLTTPYGYGGFLIEGKLTESSMFRLKQEYLRYCQQNNIVSEFVRFHPLLNNSNDTQSIFNVEEVGQTVTIDLSDKELIWDNYDSSNRRNIRKAIKSGVKINWGVDPRLIDEFIPLYNSTMKRDKAKDYYYFDREYYDYLLENLGKNIMFFYATLKEEIIAMAIIYISNKNMHYHLSASKQKHNNLYPTNYLLHEVALWGNMHGFTSFHLGGGLGANDDNLLKFKQKFNKKSITTFSTGKKIYNKEIYNHLVKVRDLDNTGLEFFPLYRS